MKNNSKSINKEVFVTSPYLPPLSELVSSLEEIWENKILTNGGPFHQKFETALAEYLGIPHISLFSNGTLALITALQALRISGEVITTPYSFVATAHSLLWNGNKPVFVDIDRNTLNLDPKKIEAAITPMTTAIMPVHCYGRPCDTSEIQRIADIYNLKIIYDACHSFAVKDAGGSICRYGDLSVLSFHATKVFNTFEGGAIICPDLKTKKRIDHLKNFGFVDETTVIAPGINGKMSEFNSAFGLIQLKHIDQAICAREILAKNYREKFSNINGINCLQEITGVNENYSYFPILVENEFSISRDELYSYLKEHGINTRRYFFPLISDFPMYKGLPSAQISNLPIANEIARKILCLPIYPDLEIDTQEKIISLIASL